MAWLDRAAFGAVLAMIVIGPYFRGLFFPKEQMAALLVALALLAARWYVKFQRGDYAFLRGPLDWAVFLLFLAYVAATFIAVNRRLAIQEDIKYLLYFIVYWLVRELAGEGLETGGAGWRGPGAAEGRRAAVLGAVALAGFWLAILGVGAAAGTFHYNGAFDGMRIYSALQYPNTLAAYLTAAFFSALALWARAGAAVWFPRGGGAGAAGVAGGAGAAAPGGLAGTPWRVAFPFWWALVLYAILFVFVFTYSRGGWLVFPVIALVYLGLAPRGARLAAAAMLVAVGAAVAPFAAPFAQAVAAKDAVGVWRAFLAGMPAALALNAVVLALIRFLLGLSPAVRAAALGGAGALGTAAAALALTRVAVPASVLERVRSISLADYDARSRIEWMADALKIVRDHPVLGAGGGAWEAIYHKYQSYGYWSTQVHNHFMQLWVETGTVGFLIFLAWWALLLWYGWRAWTVARRAGEQAAPGQAVLAGALAGALALGAHSLLDFNLSLSAVTIAMTALFAVVRAQPGAEGGAAAGPAWAEMAGRAGAAGPAPGAGSRSARRRAEAEYRLLPRAAAYGLTALAWCGVLILLLGQDAGQRAAEALNAGRVDEARVLFQRAIAYDPFTASFRMDLGQALALQAQAQGDMRLFREAQGHFEAGVARDPYNPNYHALLGSYLLQLGSFQEGLGHLEQALELHPWEAQRYETLAGALVAVARYHRQQGNDADARRLAARVLDLREQLRQRAARVPPWVVEVHRTPSSTPGMALHAGAAEALLGELAAAEQDLRAAAGGDNPQVRSEAYAWLSAVLRAQGRAADADKVLAEARALNPRADATAGQLAALLGASGGRGAGK